MAFYIRTIYFRTEEVVLLPNNINNIDAAAALNVRPRLGLQYHREGFFSVPIKSAHAHSPLNKLKLMIWNLEKLHVWIHANSR